MSGALRAPQQQKQKNNDQAKWTLNLIRRALKIKYWQTKMKTKKYIY